MATIWKLLKCRLGGDDNLTISVQEIVDGIEDKTYSARFHKKHPTSIFLADLKEQIRADRAKAQVESVVGTSINLNEFESYINTQE